MNLPFAAKQYRHGSKAMTNRFLIYKISNKKKYENDYS